MTWRYVRKNRFRAGCLRIAWQQAAIWSTGAVLVFLLPWYVGGMTPVSGPSYELGFNNRVACLAIVATLVALTAYQFSRDVLQCDRDALLSFDERPRLLPAYDTARWEYGLLAIASVVMALVQWQWNAYVVMPYWGSEQAYFLGRIDLLEMGLRPYVDFRFNYGPALLYVPYWLSHATGNALSFENAYAAVVAASFPVGYTFIFIVLRTLRISPAVRPVVLLLACGMWMPLTLGLNTSPIRFCAVPAMLVFFDAGMRRWASPVANMMQSIIGAIGAVVGCAMLSPEMGVACLGGLISYASILVVAGRHDVALTTAAGGTIAAVVVACVFPGMVVGIQSFSSGGNNFPVYPNAASLTLLGCTGFVIPGLVVSAIRKPKDMRAPLAAALSGGSVLLLPAAFGRCDPGHVAGNGFTIFMLMFAVLSSHHPASLRRWTIAFLGVFVVLAQASYWSHYRGLFADAVRMRASVADNPGALTQWRQIWQRVDDEPGLRTFPWSKVVPPPISMRTILRDRTVCLPVGADVTLERYLKKQPGYRPLYHQMPPPDWSSPRDIDRALADCLRCDVLLVPEDALSSAVTGFDREQYEQWVRSFLSKLLLWPVVGRVRNEPYVPHIDLLRRLLERCDVSATGIDGLVMLVPKRDEALSEVAPHDRLLTP